MIITIKATNGKMWALTLHDGDELIDFMKQILETNVDRIEITFAVGEKMLTLTNF